MTYKLRQRAPGVPRRMQGVGLIEVLIAVLIMAIGLLGIAAMQATTLRNSQSSAERTQAVMQTYAILDAMRANVDAARGGAYNLPMTCTPPAAGTLVANDQRSWLQSVQTSLGSTTTACGQITCGTTPATTGACTITVQWDDSRGTGNKIALTTQTLSTRTRI